MPLGDSITRGSNDTNYPNGNILGGYRRNLGILLNSVGRPYDFVGERSDNAAANMDPDHNGNDGYRTDQMLAGLPAWLSAQPNRVLLLAGTNDILQRVAISTAISNLSDIIELLILDAPNRRIYVGTILPISQDWNGVSAAVLNADANLYNTELRNLVQQYGSSGDQVYLVDLNVDLVYTNTNTSLNVFQPGDGVHPGQAGYDQMATLWYSALSAHWPQIQPPSALTATVVSGSRINLEWTDASDNETGFKIFRKTDNVGDWQLIDSVPAGSQNDAITGLRTGANSYQFAVSATNTTGDSGWAFSVTSSIENKALNKLAVASSSYSSNFGPTKANNGNPLQLWSAATTDSNAHWTVDLTGGYQIQKVNIVTRQDIEIDQPETRQNFEIRASNDPTFTSYTVLASQGDTPIPHRSTFSASVHLPNGFRFVRVAKTEEEYFTLSEVQVFGADLPNIPLPPSNLAAETAATTHVILNWNVSSSNESSIKLERMTDDGLFEEIATLPATTDTYSDSGLTAGKTYSYRVNASNESGNSDYSNIATVVTMPMMNYNTWAAQFPEFMELSEVDQEPLADPNKDGIPNLICYSIGTDPLSASTQNWIPKVTIDLAEPKQMVFTYFRNKLVTDVFREVILSSDLTSENWEIVSQGNAIATDAPGENDIESVAVKIPIETGDSVKFVRLRVSR